jgi:hypothetical protein
MQLGAIETVRGYLTLIAPVSDAIVWWHFTGTVDTTGVFPL